MYQVGGGVWRDFFLSDIDFKFEDFSSPTVRHLCHLGSRFFSTRAYALGTGTDKKELRKCVSVNIGLLFLF